MAESNEEKQLILPCQQLIWGEIRTLLVEAINIFEQGESGFYFLREASSICSFHPGCSDIERATLQTDRATESSDDARTTLPTDIAVHDVPVATVPLPQESLAQDEENIDESLITLERYVHTHCHADDKQDVFIHILPKIIRWAISIENWRPPEVGVMNQQLLGLPESLFAGLIACRFIGLLSSHSLSGLELIQAFLEGICQSRDDSSCEGVNCLWSMFQYFQSLPAPGNVRGVVCITQKVLVDLERIQSSDWLQCDTPLCGFRVFRPQQKSKANLRTGDLILFPPNHKPSGSVSEPYSGQCLYNMLQSYGTHTDCYQMMATDGPTTVIFLLDFSQSKQTPLLRLSSNQPSCRNDLDYCHSALLCSLHDTYTAYMSHHGNTHSLWHSDQDVGQAESKASSRTDEQGAERTSARLLAFSQQLSENILNEALQISAHSHNPPPRVNQPSPNTTSQIDRADSLRDEAMNYGQSDTRTQSSPGGATKLIPGGSTIVRDHSPGGASGLGHHSLSGSTAIPQDTRPKVPKYASGFGSHAVSQVKKCDLAKESVHQQDNTSQEKLFIVPVEEKNSSIPGRGDIKSYHDNGEVPTRDKITPLFKKILLVEEEVEEPRFIPHSVQQTCILEEASREMSPSDDTNTDVATGPPSGHSQNQISQVHSFAQSLVQGLLPLSNNQTIENNADDTARNHSEKDVEGGSMISGLQSMLQTGVSGGVGLACSQLTNGLHLRENSLSQSQEDSNETQDQGQKAYQDVTGSKESHGQGQKAYQQDVTFSMEVDTEILNGDKERQVGKKRPAIEQDGSISKEKPYQIQEDLNLEQDDEQGNEANLRVEPEQEGNLGAGVSGTKETELRRIPHKTSEESGPQNNKKVPRTLMTCPEEPCEDFLGFGSLRPHQEESGDESRVAGAHGTDSAGSRPMLERYVEGMLQEAFVCGFREVEARLSREASPTTGTGAAPICTAPPEIHSYVEGLIGDTFESAMYRIQEYISEMSQGKISDEKSVREALYMSDKALDQQWNSQLTAFVDDFVLNVMEEALFVHKIQNGTSRRRSSGLRKLNEHRVSHASSVDSESSALLGCAGPTTSDVDMRYLQCELSTDCHGNTRGCCESQRRGSGASSGRQYLRADHSSGSSRRGSFEEEARSSRRRSSAGFKDSVLSEFEDELVHSDISTPDLRMFELTDDDEDVQTKRRASEPYHRHHTDLKCETKNKKRARSVDSSTSRKVILQWLDSQSSSSSTSSGNSKQQRTTSSHLDWFAQDLLVEAFNDAFVTLYGRNYEGLQSTDCPQHVPADIINFADGLSGVIMEESLQDLSVGVTARFRGSTDGSSGHLLFLPNTVADTGSTTDSQDEYVDALDMPISQLEQIAEDFSSQILAEAIDIVRRDIHSQEQGSLRHVLSSIQLRVMVEWAAATRAGVSCVLYPPGGSDHLRQLSAVTSRLRRHHYSVADLMHLICSFLEDRADASTSCDLFSFILDKLQAQ